MISAASIISFLRKNAAFILVLLISAVLRFYKLSQIFPFDYDQQIPAESAYDFFINHKLTLIGQELSFKGFFLGPVHNWIEFIPYGICNLRPDCVPYFYSLISLISLFFLYLIIKKIFDQKTALIASAIYGFSFAAISFEIGVNSNYFIFSTSLALLYCIYMYFQGQNKYLLLGGFLAGLATVNFNPVFIFSSMAFFTASFFRNNQKKSTVFLSLTLFFLNFLPLVIFNLRHEGILVKNFQHFLQSQATSSDIFDQIFYVVSHVSVPFFATYLFQSANYFFILMTVLLIMIGFFICHASNKKISYYLAISILFPIIGFFFYSGFVQTYYFQQSALSVILFFSLVLGRNVLVFIPALALFLYLNLISFFHFKGDMNYQFKKRIVSFVINDSQEESFNVYYTMPPGINTGYHYLFKAFHNSPVEGGENLYILEFSNPSEFKIEKYKSTYVGKEVKVKVFGFIHVVSVK